MGSFYRLDSASRDLSQLLDPERHSSPWVDGAMMAACPSCGTDVYTDRVDGMGDCPSCGLVDVAGPRPGVSACETVSDLAAYFRDREMDDGPLVLVELAGEPTGSPDHDANAIGAPILIRPTDIVSVTPYEE
ncbi:hypothetical protein [Phytoactinopolyspora limicola]|uniref:hypothetical protein n=1 Tax=Phytoactinopolyspora limicola TaxID=2715536 RepID=UPI00140B9517|nr:hypothetical protein [Phytoactinopolyspora limicola]